LENERVIDRQKLLEAFNLHSSGHREKAEELYQKIIGTDPCHPDSLHLLGGLALCLGRDRLASEMLNRAIQLNSDRSHYYGTLGDVYKKQGKLKKALRCYQKAEQLNPSVAEIMISLANIHHLEGRVDDAITCYRKALKANSNSVPALVGLGTIYKEQGLTKDAESLYLRSLRAAANDGAKIKSALLMPVICNSIESIQHYRTKIRSQIGQLKKGDLHLDDPYLQVGTTGFHLAYHGMGTKDIQQSIASLYLNTCSDLSWTDPACCRRKPRAGKIVVGIISQFLHQHTIGYLNYGIIKYLNRERFHVNVFRFKVKDDPLSNAINQAADEIIYLPDDLNGARRIIAEQALDILFFLDIGMEALTYFLAFSRLAPVQCTTWGHADTSGIPNLDYYLSSVDAEPFAAQAHYSEQLILLNRFPMYCQYPEVPNETPNRERFGLPLRSNLYMCCQSLFKFHPDFDVFIKSILERDPNGVLLLFEGKHASWGKLLRKRFARTMPEVDDRIRFYPRIPRKDFLSLIRLTDVMIDTIHFCGGYTSLLCFACGIPVVTLPGSFMRGRMTYAFYKQMSIFDCVATDIQSFTDIAYTLATNKAWRNEISKKIRDQATALFEDMETVYELERFFEWAVKKAERSHHQSVSIRYPKCSSPDLPADNSYLEI
jgi:predicted O-linked N-acetylglucosamine transferase (SPINDLY family)